MQETQPKDPSREEAPREGLGTTSRQKVLLKDIMRGGRELVIVHGPDEYLLRVTKNGKLILTK